MTTNTDIGEDPDLLPEEKQVSLTTTKKDNDFIIHSEVASITRYIINHPVIEVTNTREKNGQIVSATGQLPRGLVDLKAVPRQSDQFGRITSSAPLRDNESGEE